MSAFSASPPRAVLLADDAAPAFAPLSYERPIACARVRGEVLAERVIFQLRAAGVRDITLVTGYRADDLSYLAEKCGVALLPNPEYFRRGSLASLALALAEGGMGEAGLFVLPAASYFVRNAFTQLPSRSTITAADGGCACPRALADEGGRVREILPPGKQREGSLPLRGYVYFTCEDAARLAELLREPAEERDPAESIFDFLARHTADLPLDLRALPREDLPPLETVDDLRALDPGVLSRSACPIIANICQALSCREEELSGFAPVTQGLTNRSFHFTLRGSPYIYRHPGEGTDEYISRRSEGFSMGVARRLGLDETLVAFSESEGWKISRFLEGVHTLNYRCEREVRAAIAMIRRLHEAKIRSEFNFDLWGKTLALASRARALSDLPARAPDFEQLLSRVTALHARAAADGVPWVLCHCDCYDPNFLVSPSGKMTLIDWEYSGNDDPAGDLGTFICCSDYTYEEARGILRLYYGGEPPRATLRHALAYVALASYYWYVWAILQEAGGNPVGDYLTLWHDGAASYEAIARDMYEE